MSHRSITLILYAIYLAHEMPSCSAITTQPYTHVDVNLKVKRGKKLSRAHRHGTLLHKHKPASFVEPAALTVHGGDEDAPPSIYWPILHNWLYFMSLGFNLINIQFLVREIIDGDPKAKPSAKSIALSGKVESVDKLLTFLGIGFLSALSDKFGRKPLM